MRISFPSKSFTFILFFFSVMWRIRTDATRNFQCLLSFIFTRFLIGFWQEREFSLSLHFIQTTFLFLFFPDVFCRLSIPIFCLIVCLSYYLQLVDSTHLLLFLYLFLCIDRSVSLSVSLSFPPAPLALCSVILGYLLSAPCLFAWHSVRQIPSSCRVAWKIRRKAAALLLNS